MTVTTKPRSIRLLAGFFTVSSWTLASRIMGFIRDILIAAFFGAGPVAEAFQVAFALPNMFRRFFAEGAFNMAFVPMFSKKLESGEDARQFAQNAMAGLASVLIGLTLIAQLFMPWFVLAMASGFAGDERFDLATDFARICFPYILFISLAALLSGVLNSMGRFAAAAAAPVVLNIILISAMVATWALGGNVALALAWGVPVAGVGQLALVWIAASRAGIRLLPQLPRFTPEIRRLAMIAAPAALAGGVVQVNLLVGRQVASYFDGAIQWLAVADRLYQLPLGVVGIAIGVVLLPDLSRKLQSADEAGGRHAFNRATEFALALTLPAAVGLLVVPQAVVSVLFERGAFTAEDARNTAAALSIYAIGLPAFVLQKVFQPLYFARENTKTPFYFALVSMVLNAALAIGLSVQFGYLAAAIGTTLSSVALAVMLYFGTRRMGLAAAFDDRLLRALPRMLVACVIMGLFTYGLEWLLSDWLVTEGLRYLALALLVVGGTSVYFAACLMLGAFTKQGLRNVVRR
ncbi:murein biosynthesis integral membrane protein MurJ [Neptunicoccus sediminis]|uniref:murein biosynthesis integral membrane protein MurJ n=1 Tax=Neptunicoccus sediminis TaxID=1892596 RepID=UPI000AE45C35